MPVFGKRFGTLGLQALLALALIQNRALGEQMNSLIYGRDIQSTPLGPQRAGGPFAKPKDLLLQVDPLLRMDHDFVIATAGVRNPTDAAIEAVIIGDQSFAVNLEDKSEVRRYFPYKKNATYMGLEVMSIPPHSEVLFENRTALQALQYEGTPTATFIWQFLFAGTRSEGIFKPVALPKRTTRDAYFIQGQPVTETEYQKTLQSLTGKEAYYSERNLEGGGQIGWESKDAQGRTQKVIENANPRGWHTFEIYLAPPPAAQSATARDSRYRVPRESLAPLSETLPPRAVYISQNGLISERFEITISEDRHVLYRNLAVKPAEKGVRTFDLSPKQIEALKRLVDAVWKEGARPPFQGQKEIVQTVLLVDGEAAFEAVNKGSSLEGSSQRLFNWIVEASNE